MPSYGDIADLARPDLPKPGCRVKLVCGPPAAGKTTYVRKHAKPGDIVIDFDRIATRSGYGRDRPPNVVGALLEERNTRLAELAYEKPERTAWVILTAPSQSLRQWWREVLNVQPDDLVLLVPDRRELERRVMADPWRKKLMHKQMSLINQWFIKEHRNDPGITKPGHDEFGLPLESAASLEQMSTLSSYVLDNGLQAIDVLADKIFVCSQEPTTYSEATTTGTYALGVKNFGSAGGAINGTMADASPTGRKIVTNAITAGSVLAAGTVTAWALVDSANSRLLATGEVTSLAVTGGTFDMNAITISEPAT